MVQKAVVRPKESIRGLPRVRQLRGMGRLGGAAFCRLQRAHSGCKTDGELTKGPEKVVNCWYEHF